MENKTKQKNSSLESEIILYKDSKTKMVRELRQEKKDYDALARCYNSFKDSDSWPGGFGGSFIFTGEYVENRYKGTDHTGRLIITDPDEPDKIIGVSLCCRTWNLPDSWYVEVLGVDPKYQGQKFGKALLLESTKFAMERNARFISLHTWGGNLKAMPLYKRQGYKWRPNSSVYMENYIPQILNYPYFKDFFSEFLWYDVFKPEINQVPDAEFEEKMHVYEYNFKMDEKHSLKIWVDRSIGWISGFHKKLKNEDLLVKVFTPNTEAFIGFEEFPIRIIVGNNGSFQKELKIKTIPTKQIEILDQVPTSIIAKPNEKKVVEFQAKIKADADEFNMEIQTQNYCEHQIVFEFTTDGISFPIKIGKAPLNALKILPLPKNFATIPNHEFTLPLDISNFLGKEEDIVLEIQNGTYTSFTKHKFNLTVSTYDSLLEISAKTKASETTADYIPVVAKTKKGEILHKKSIPILIFNDEKSVVYELDQQTIVENKNYRVYFYKKPNLGSNEMIIFDKKRNLELKGNAIVLGYPFDEEGGEFFSKELKHEIIEEATGIWILSTGESQDRKGIKATRKFFIPHTNQPITLTYILENTTKETFDNLGILVGSYWWPGQKPISQVVIPHIEGILEFNHPEVPAELDVESDILTEGWKAIEFVNGTIGFMTDLDKIYKMDVNRRFPKFEFKIEKIHGKQKIESSPIYYCFTDAWQSVQKIWRDIFSPSKNNDFYHYLHPKPMKKFGLLSNDQIIRGILLDKNQKEISVAFKFTGKACPKCSLKLELNEKLLKKKEFKIDDFNDVFWKEKAQIKNQPKSPLVQGTLFCNFGTRTFKKPVTLGFYNSKDSIKISKSNENGKEIFEVKNGFMTFKGSKAHAGTIHYLAVENDHNYLNSSFPEAKPFLWFSKFHGGIGTIIHPYRQWIGEEKYYENVSFESFKISKGNWAGFGFKSNIFSYTPSLKGIQSTVNYLTLPDAPLILVQHIIENHSNTKRKCTSQTTAAVSVTKTNEDNYFALDRQGRMMTYNTYDHQSTIHQYTRPNNQFATYKNSKNKYYLSTIRLRDIFDDTVYAYTPNKNFLVLGNESDEITINPNEKITLNTLILLSSNLDQIEPFTESNILEILETK